MFHKLLESDVDFKAQFDFEQNLKRAIKNKENQDLKRKLISFEKDIATETPKLATKKSYRYLAIAASVLLLIGLAWMGYLDGSSNKYEDLYAANFQEYPNTVFAITRGDAIESVERDAFVAYEGANYQIALENFNKIPDENRAQYLDFYIGQSFLNLNQNQKAKELFKKTIDSRSDFEAEAYWYLALIALKEKDKASAMNYLKELTSKFDYNKNRALELLQELE